MYNFFNFSLSSFNTSDFEYGVAPVNSTLDPEVCYYPDFRWPPNHHNKYQKSERFWHVLAARLIFVLVYQQFIVILKTGLRYILPANSKLKKQIRKENLKLGKIMNTEHEKNREIQGNVSSSHRIGYQELTHSVRSVQHKSFIRV